MLRIPFILLLNVFSLVGWCFNYLVYGMSRLFNKRKRYVEIPLQAAFPLGRSRSWNLLDRGQTSLLEFREDLQKLGEDDETAGVVVRLQEPLMLGPARMAEIADWLESVRERGKELIFHADSMSTRAYGLAASGDAILLSPAARLYTFGLRIDQFFASPLLARLGVRAHFIHIGPYKTAANRFIRESMQPSERGMMEELLDRLRDDYLSRVERGRGSLLSDPAVVHDLAPLDARKAITAGLADAETFAPDIARWLESRESHIHLADGPEKPQVEVLKWSEYESARRPELNWRPLRRRPRFAVLDLSGVITQSDGGPSTGGAVVDPDEVLPVLKRIAGDRRVKGVLLHINSPGGSALGSDLMWKGIEELRARKPVVAYCSDVAASGGYYLAVGADRIIARRESIIGSIGVITGKFTVNGLTDRLGVNVEEIQRDPSASFTSVFQPLEGEVLEQLKDDTRAFYRRFLQRVGRARNIPRRRLHRYARGRVYVGEDALRRGLVDGLGGLEEALATLAELSETSLEKADLDFVAHKRQSLSMALRSALYAGVRSEFPIDGLAHAHTAMTLFKREPTLALWPYALPTGSAE